MAAVAGGGSCSRWRCRQRCAGGGRGRGHCAWPRARREWPSLRGANVELAPLLTHYEATLAAWRGEPDREPAARALTDAAGTFTLRAPEGGFWKTVVRARAVRAGRLSAGAALGRGDAGRPATRSGLASRARIRSSPPLLTATRADGGFELAGVSGGVYDITIDAAGYAITAVPGWEIAAGDSDTDLGVLRVGPGVLVEGLVVEGGPDEIDAEKPLAGATIDVQRDRSFARIDATPGPEPWSAWLESEPSREELKLESDGDGRFTLRDVNPSEKVELARCWRATCRRGPRRERAHRAAGAARARAGGDGARTRGGRERRSGDEGERRRSRRRIVAAIHRARRRRR